MLAYSLLEITGVVGGVVIGVVWIALELVAMKRMRRIEEKLDRALRHLDPSQPPE